MMKYKPGDMVRLTNSETTKVYYILILERIREEGYIVYVVGVDGTVSVSATDIYWDWEKL